MKKNSHRDPLGGRELLGPLFEFVNATEAEEARLLAKSIESLASSHCLDIFRPDFQAGLFYSIHGAHEMDEASLDTYEEIKAALPARRAAVLAELEDLGGEASAEQLADRLGWEKAHLMPRITELRKQGVIGKTGRTRGTRAGKTENIWEIREGTRGALA